MTLNYFEGTLDGSVPSLSVFSKYKKHMDACEYKIILEELWSEFGVLNQFIETQRPWFLIKTDKVKCCEILKNAINRLRQSMIYLKPFLPEMAAKVYNSFTFKTPWEKISLDAIGEDQVEYPVSVNKEMLVNGKYPPLFARK
jgi:methionyl-tRNA synthetase